MSQDKLDQEKEAAAADAAERIKSGEHWKDWRTIAEGLEVGRRYAMRLAGTNQPIGRGYNTEFGKWMDTRPWARELDKTTRNHLFWYVDHAAAVEGWRETLSSNQRSAWTHPTTIWRKYTAAHRIPEQKPEAARTSLQAANDKIVELQEEVDSKQAEIDSLRADRASLGDGPEEIADGLRALYGDATVRRITEVLMREMGIKQAAPAQLERVTRAPMDLDEHIRLNLEANATREEQRKLAAKVKQQARRQAKRAGAAA
jgi:hypothetical protein